MSVAIVGSVPAGLSAAGDLVQKKKGHRVRVLEALHAGTGGISLFAALPNFAFPKSIVKD